MADDRPRTSAPRVTIPDDELLCIEHPCIIKNVDKGLRSLGGGPAIERV